MNEEKFWYASKTIWGSLISVAAALAAAFGVSIDAATQGAVADVMIQIVGAAGALFAIYGRLTATDTIA